MQVFYVTFVQPIRINEATISVLTISTLSEFCLEENVILLPLRNIAYYFKITQV